MWLIALMLLLMVPLVCAALVYLLVALWRALDALVQGTIGAVRIAWRAVVWLMRASLCAAQLARRGVLWLREWHYLGSTWAGQYLQASYLAWSNMLRRRYVAGQLRRLRRERVHK